MHPLWLLISCSWKAALLVALAALVLRLLRRAPAAERRSVWAAIFVGLLMLPVASIVWSRIPLSVAADGAAERTLVADGITVIHVVAGAANHAPWGINWILLIWALGVIAMLAWTSFGYLRANLYLRSAETLDVPWRHTHAGDHRVLCSPSAPVPMVVGLWRPIIVLPQAARNWNTEQLHRVLSHEAAHLRHRDARWNLLSSIVVSLYWFHPLVWLAASRFESEREHACDDVVLAAGNRASHYAADLLDFAKLAAAGSIPRSVIPMASPTRLELRISAILDGTKHRQPLRRNIVMSYTLVLALLLLPLSAVQSFARTSTPEELRTEIRQILISLQESSQFDSRVSAEIVSLAQSAVEEADRRYASMPSPAPEPPSAAPQPEPVPQPVAAMQQSETPKRIRVGGAVAEHKVLRKVQPVYPQGAKDDKVQGTVRLNILIDPEGHVVETEVVNSPDDRLSQASIDAVSQWLYSPTLLNGDPVEVVTIVDINFTLQ